MGRPPIGKTAMTAAERQQRSRERRGIGGSYWPNFYPWDRGTGPRSIDQIPSRAVSEFIDQLDKWMDGDGSVDDDIEPLAKWLSFQIDSDRWERIDERVRSIHQEKNAAAENCDEVSVTKLNTWAKRKLIGVKKTASDFSDFISELIEFSCDYSNRILAWHKVNPELSGDDKKALLHTIHQCADRVLGLAQTLDGR